MFLWKNIPPYVSFILRLLTPGQLFQSHPGPDSNWLRRINGFSTIGGYSKIGRETGFEPEISDLLGMIPLEMYIDRAYSTV